MTDASTGSAPNSWAHYLDPGERLLWEGQPQPGVKFRMSDIFLSLFGVFWLSFSVFWTYMAGTMGQGAGFSAFGLFGLPFIAIGIYLVFGRFFWDAFVRSRTRYALTDRRAIIAKNAMRRQMRSFRLTPDDELVFEPGDPATIWFKRETRGHGKNRTTVRHGFEFVSDGDRLFRVMRAIQRGDTENIEAMI